MNIEELKELKYIFARVDDKSKNAIDKADQICNGKIYLLSSLSTLFVENVDDIWNLEAEPINTYKAYLYSLAFIGYLNNAYKYTSDKKYIDKSVIVIKSWINYKKNSKETNINYDFTVSIRTMILTEFLGLCKNNNIKLESSIISSLTESIKDDVRILMDDTKYRYDNHGIMMDRALLQYATLYSNVEDTKGILKKSIERINFQIKDAFFKDGINKENSPEYHKLTYDLFYEINKFLVENGIGSCEFEFEDIYQRHLDLLKPNQTYPMVGDSSEIEYKNDTPNLNSKIFTESGIAIFKNRFGYLFSKCGFEKKAHKHFDDTSFNFSYLNNDIFIDAGKYTYKNDKYRKYFISVHAHNLVNIDSQNYELDKEKLFVDKYYLDNEIEVVKMINKAYKNSEVIRTIVYIKPNIIFINDNVKSEYKRSYNQVFNIGEKFEIINSSKNNLLLGNKDNITIDIRQINEVDEYEIFKGYKNGDIIRGFSSKFFNKLIENYSIVFKHIDKEKCMYTTICKICSKENFINEYNDVNIKSIKGNYMEAILYKENKEYHIEIDIENNKYTKRELPKVEAKCLNDKLYVNFEKIDDVKYAVYIISKNRIIHKEYYTSNNKFEFEMCDKCSILAFVKFDDGVKVERKYEVY